MITIISATNRPGNITRIFADKYFQLLKIKGQEVKFFSMEDLPDSFGLKNIYDYHHPELYKLVEEFIIPAEKLVIFIPEYNAGIPGVFKVFIDSVKPSIFSGKKAALVGISSGRSGNIRGIDHLTTILHYINVDVLPHKLPVSKIEEILQGKSELTEESTINAMNYQIDKLINWK
jgi:chromate reductase, NAD(P)H dehydrogenase (quinone)